jgi:hypothetical protein
MAAKVIGGIDTPRPTRSNPTPGKMASLQLQTRVQANFMEYRGVRYAIRIGIARNQWQAAIYLPDNELPKETTVVGTRGDAEIAAHRIIDAWIKKRFRRFSYRPEKATTF